MSGTLNAAQDTRADDGDEGEHEAQRQCYLALCTRMLRCLQAEDLHGACEVAELLEQLPDSTCQRNDTPRPSTVLLRMRDEFGPSFRLHHIEDSDDEDEDDDAEDYCVDEDRAAVILSSDDCDSDSESDVDVDSEGDGSDEPRVTRARR